MSASDHLPGHYLSRYAAASYWMARYMERAENVARMLDVMETFTRDGSGQQNWLSIVQINSDEERFLEQHKPTAAAVKCFYAIDADNPTSIVSAIQAARENARTLRPAISTEMWQQINMVHARTRALASQHVLGAGFADTCAAIKEGCQLFEGIVEGTYFRDQGWYFHEIGKLLERADQTTRLLDIKYHLLLPQADYVGSPFDIAQWQALLRSAAGYYAYRRVHPSGMSPASVAGFLLLNPAFPRSALSCVRRAERLLRELIERFALADALADGGVLDRVISFRAYLEETDIAHLIETGLHEALDGIQLSLFEIGAGLDAAFFNRERPVAEDGGQAQSQGSDGTGQNQG